MKPCRIVDESYQKSQLSFGVNPAQNSRVAAILDFRYHTCILCIFSSTFVRWRLHCLAFSKTTEDIPFCLTYGISENKLTVCVLS